MENCCQYHQTSTLLLQKKGTRWRIKRKASESGYSRGSTRLFQKDRRNIKQDIRKYGTPVLPVVFTVAHSELMGNSRLFQFHMQQCVIGRKSIIVATGNKPGNCRLLIIRQLLEQVVHIVWLILGNQLVLFDIRITLCQISLIIFPDRRT